MPREGGEGPPKHPHGVGREQDLRRQTWEKRLARQNGKLVRRKCWKKLERRVLTSEGKKTASVLPVPGSGDVGEASSRREYLGEI